ncbi:MAG: hypothetical protein ACXWH7_01435 [Thermoanaerobaculia bacterium]
MTFTPLLLVGVLLYGIPLALALDTRLRGATLAGASFLLGAGAAGLHLFALSVMQVPWTRTSVVLSMIPLFAIATFAASRRAPVILSREDGEGPPSDGAESVPATRSFAVSAASNDVEDVIGVIEAGPGSTACPRLGQEALPAVPAQDDRATALPDLLTIAFVVAYAIFALWAAPYEWDFYGIWGLKARWFFETRGMDWATVPHIGKADYPVLMPLLFDFVAVVTKTWNDRAFGWIYVVLCASVLAIARGMFADEVKYPALATLAIAFPTLNLWIGLAEAGVMAFGCAGLLFIRRGSIALGAVLLGLAAWSKNEGLALIAVSAIALFIATRSIRRVIRLWPAIAIVAPWMITRSVLKLSTDFMEGSTTQRVFDRLGNPSEVVRAFVNAPPDQPWFWLAALLAVLAFIRDAIRREAFLLIAVALQLGLMFAQALATTWDFAAHVSLTLNRLPHQIAPAAGFLAAIVLMRQLFVAQGDRGIDGGSSLRGDGRGEE